MMSDDEKPEYDKMVPKEIRLAMSRLGRGDEDSKFAILIALLDSDSLKKEGEIAEMIDKAIDETDEMLDDLQCAGMVARKVGDRIGDKSTGGYEVTAYGKRILDGLYEAIQPKFTNMIPNPPQPAKHTTGTIDGYSFSLRVDGDAPTGLVADIESALADVKKERENDE